MAKQVIAVDIDDVLAATAESLVAYSNQQWGMNLVPEDYRERWGEMWGVDVETERQRATHVHEQRLFRDFTHDEAALPVLTRLAEKYELVIATSRTRNIRDDTLEWLELHYPGLFSDVHQSGLYDEFTAESHLGTKAELIKEIGADYLIDDQPKHCLAVAEAGIETILFGDYSWQRGLELPAGVTRCHDWAAVGEYFDGR